MKTAPQRRHSDADDPSTSSEEVRVLLVDDDEHFRLWLTLLTRRLGFIVETAVDGEEALQLLRAHAYDLLISDFEMPRLDGFELIRAIRRDETIAHQYAVMLTSHDDLDAKIAALSVGYDDFLSKSCTEVEVVAKVVAAKRMLSRQRKLADAAREWELLATRDDLTGVATRRTIYARIDVLLTERRQLGLAIIDLDDFKLVNDTYGHLTGDRILRDLGALFLARTRANDLIARYGGDEFLLLVPDSAVEDVRGAAERVISDLEALRWRSGDTAFGIHATSGVAHTSQLPAQTLEALVDAADRDLYARKLTKKREDPPRARRRDTVDQILLRPDR
ncbi:MAG TPA: diguanylate cyclase [Thermoanaerobaculia bacterium]|nr:diguanylate cyclase [Thermoanaerobaculia bacterium]